MLARALLYPRAGEPRERDESAEYCHPGHLGRMSVAVWSLRVIIASIAARE